MQKQRHDKTGKEPNNELTSFSVFSAQQIDLREQPWGIYVVSVYDGVNTFTKKVVVR